MDPLLRLLRNSGSEIDQDLCALDVARSDFANPPLFSLSDCVREISGRLNSENKQLGMISREKLTAMRHYLTEFALIYRIP